MSEQLDWLDKAGSDDDGSWLEISEAPSDANAHKVPYEELRFSCMRGSGRVWACDGEYMAFRPFNREHDKIVNPAFEERIQRFRDDGHFEFIGTFDEVQVYKLLEGSPWKTKDDALYVAGKNYWSDVRQVAKYACERKWPDYHDLLAAMASGMKTGREPTLARMAWEDALQQIQVNIYQMQGPTPAECNAGLQNVRRDRGLSSSGSVLVLDAAPKQVQFEK